VVKKMLVAMIGLHSSGEGGPCGFRGMSATHSDLMSAADSEVKSAIPI
jgi:hypothetical protein